MPSPPQACQNTMDRPMQQEFTVVIRTANSHALSRRHSGQFAQERRHLPGRQAARRRGANLDQAGQHARRAVLVAARPAVCRGWHSPPRGLPGLAAHGRLSGRTSARECGRSLSALDKAGAVQCRRAGPVPGHARIAVAGRMAQHSRLERSCARACGRAELRSLVVVRPSAGAPFPGERRVRQSGRASR